MTFFNKNSLLSMLFLALTLSSFSSGATFLIDPNSPDNNSFVTPIFMPLINFTVQGFNPNYCITNMTSPWLGDFTLTGYITSSFGVYTCAFNFNEEMGEGTWYVNNVTWQNSTFHAAYNTYQWNLTVDITGPGVALNAPANGAAVNNASGLVWFYFTPTDASPGKLRNASLWLNNTGTGRSFNVSNSSNLVSGQVTSFQLSGSGGIADGSASWLVQVCDESHNCTNSSARVVHTLSGPPSVSVQAPASNAFNNNASGRAAFYFTPTQGAFALKNASIFLNSTGTGRDVNASNASTLSSGSVNSITLPVNQGVANASISWLVQVCDVQNQCTNSSASVLHVDTAEPQSVLTAPASNAFNNNASGRATFYFTPADSFGSIKNASLWLNSSGTGQAQNTSNQSAVAAGSVNSITLSAGQGVANASTSWLVQVCDEANNCANSSSRTVHVDTTEPSVVLNAPATSAFIGNASGLVRFYFTPSDSFGVIKNASLWLNNTGTGRAYNLTNSSDLAAGVNSLVLPAGQGIANGSASWLIRVCDEANNCANASARVVHADTVQPSVALNAPADGATVGNASGLVRFYFTPSDSFGVIKNASLWLNNTGTGRAYNLTNSSDLAVGVNSLVLPAGQGIANGSASWLIQVCDEANNCANSTARMVNVSTSIGEITVSISSPEASDYLNTAGATVTFTATHSLGTQMTCTLSTDGVTASSATVNSGASSTLSAASLSESTHTLSVSCTDGSVTTATSVSVTVDRTTPVISGLAVNGISTGMAGIDWTTSEASDSMVEYGTTTAYGTSATVLTMQTTHSVLITSNLLPRTTYHYRVRSCDAASNCAYSADATFTTSGGGGASGGGGGGSPGQGITKAKPSVSPSVTPTPSATPKPTNAKSCSVTLGSPSIQAGSSTSATLKCYSTATPSQSSEVECPEMLLAACAGHFEKPSISGNRPSFSYVSEQNLFGWPDGCPKELAALHKSFYCTAPITVSPSTPQGPCAGKGVYGDPSDRPLSAGINNAWFQSDDPYKNGVDCTSPKYICPSGKMPRLGLYASIKDSNDYLEVQDGDGNVIDKVNDANFGLSSQEIFQPSTLSYAVQSIKFKFHSDSSNNQGTFALYGIECIPLVTPGDVTDVIIPDKKGPTPVVPAKPSSACNADSGQRFNDDATHSVQFETGHPYADNMNCPSGVYSCPQGKSVELTLSLSTEQNFDVLKIFNVDDNSVVETLSGSTGQAGAPSTIKRVIPHNNVKLAFTSDDSNAGQYYGVKLKQVKCVGKQAQQQACVADQGVSIVTVGRSTKPVSFEFSHPITATSKCASNLYGCPGNRLRALIKSDLPPAARAYAYDGATRSSPKPVMLKTFTDKTQCSTASGVSDECWHEFTASSVYFEVADNSVTPSGYYGFKVKSVECGGPLTSTPDTACELNGIDSASPGTKVSLSLSCTQGVGGRAVDCPSKTRWSLTPGDSTLDEQHAFVARVTLKSDATLTAASDYQKDGETKTVSCSKPLKALSDNPPVTMSISGPSAITESVHGNKGEYLATCSRQGSREPCPPVRWSTTSGQLIPKASPSSTGLDVATSRDEYATLTATAQDGGVQVMAEKAIAIRPAYPSACKIEKQGGGEIYAVKCTRNGKPVSCSLASWRWSAASVDGASVSLSEGESTTLTYGSQRASLQLNANGQTENGLISCSLPITPPRLPGEITSVECQLDGPTELKKEETATYSVKTTCNRDSSVTCPQMTWQWQEPYSYASISPKDSYSKEVFVQWNQGTTAESTSFQVYGLTSDNKLSATCSKTIFKWRPEVTPGPSARPTLPGSEAACGRMREGEILTTSAGIKITVSKINNAKDVLDANVELRGSDGVTAQLYATGFTAFQGVVVAVTEIGDDGQPYVRLMVNGVCNAVITRPTAAPTPTPRPFPAGELCGLDVGDFVVTPEGNTLSLADWQAGQKIRVMVLDNSRKTIYDKMVGKGETFVAGGNQFIVQDVTNSPQPGKAVAYFLTTGGPCRYTPTLQPTPSPTVRVTTAPSASPRVTSTPSATTVPSVTPTATTMPSTTPLPSGLYCKVLGPGYPGQLHYPAGQSATYQVACFKGENPASCPAGTSWDWTASNNAVIAGRTEFPGFATMKLTDATTFTTVTATGTSPQSTQIICTVKVAPDYLATPTPSPTPTPTPSPTPGPVQIVLSNLIECKPGTYFKVIREFDPYWSSPDPNGYRTTNPLTFDAFATIIGRSQSSILSQGQQACKVNQVQSGAVTEFDFSSDLSEACHAECTDLTCNSFKPKSIKCYYLDIPDLTLQTIRDCTPGMVFAGKQHRSEYESSTDFNGLSVFSMQGNPGFEIQGHQIICSAATVRRIDQVAYTTYWFDGGTCSELNGQTNCYDDNLRLLPTPTPLTTTTPTPSVLEPECTVKVYSYRHFVVEAGKEMWIASWIGGAPGKESLFMEFKPAKLSASLYSPVSVKPDQEYDVWGYKMTLVKTDRTTSPISADFKFKPCPSSATASPTASPSLTPTPTTIPTPTPTTIPTPTPTTIPTPTVAPDASGEYAVIIQQMKQTTYKVSLTYSTTIRGSGNSPTISNYVVYRKGSKVKTVTGGESIYCDESISHCANLDFLLLFSQSSSETNSKTSDRTIAGKSSTCFISVPTSLSVPAWLKHERCFEKTTGAPVYFNGPVQGRDLMDTLLSATSFSTSVSDADVTPPG